MAEYRAAIVTRPSCTDKTADGPQRHALCRSLQWLSTRQAASMWSTPIATPRSRQGSPKYTIQSESQFRAALRRGKSGSKGSPCLPIPWHVVQYRVALGGVGQRDCNLRVARRKVERKPGVVQLARPVLPESVHRLSIAHRQQPLQTTVAGAAAPNAPRASVQLGLKAIQVLC